MSRSVTLVLSFLTAVLMAGVGSLSAASPATSPSAGPASRPAPVVRVAAIGGINEQGFWKAVSERFEQKSGIRIETVTTGNKDAVADLFKRAGIDLIAIQSADAMMALVAEGYASDPQPWVSTELIIVGPPADPAGIKGMKDAAAAVRKIITSKSAFVVHGSLGADEVVRGIIQAGKVQLPEGQTVVLLDDHQKHVLQAAAERHAYTLISAIAFRGGKIPAGGLVELVAGDPILRRPFMVAVANPLKIADAHGFAARRLAEFLRSDETQQWIDHWRQGQPGEMQEFFPVAGTLGGKLPAGVTLRLAGDIDQRLDFTPEQWAKFPRTTVAVPGKDGSKVTYTGVMLRDVLRAANIPLGTHQLRGPWVDRAVHVHAADGYQAAFALAELDNGPAESSVILADQKDGSPLPPGEGPLRVIAPGDIRPARWAKMATVLEVR
jgi:tungstate transport system substrate-binding protein